MRHVRRRSNTADEPSTQPLTAIDTRASRSAYPRAGFAPIDEAEDAFPVGAASSARASHSRTHSSATASTCRSEASSSTAFSSPPPSLARAAVPYGDGPIELIPGVYLGAEESVYDWTRWSAASERVRILNVAQEIDDPWAGEQVDRKGKGKVSVARYPAEPVQGRPELEYCHLSWGHGEAGLAEVDETMRLQDVVRAGGVGKGDEDKEKWRFWEAIRWVEEGRRNGEAVLIQ
jgi:hypothetical protein